MTSSEEFLENVDLKIVETELVRDSNFPTCRDQDLNQTLICKNVEIKTRQRLQELVEICHSR